MEIPLKIGKYDYVRNLGAGSFSAVVLVKDRTTLDLYACKVCVRKLFVDKGIYERFEREVRMMEFFRHPNVVELREIIFEEELIFLIMEYCSGGELYHLITERGKLDEWSAIRLFNQIVDGLSYVHARDIAHRDLKPENILLDQEGTIKLSDFGLCHHVDPKIKVMMTPCGSPYYASPEIIQNVPYDGKKTDVWSLGVVLFAMVTGNLPWKDINQAQLFEQILTGDFEIPLSLSPHLRNLISQLMKINPDERPDITEIKNHPWVSMVDATAGIYGEAAKMTKSLQVLTRYSSSVKRALIVRPPKPVSETFNWTLNPPMARQLLRRVPHQAGKRKSVPKVNGVSETHTVDHLAATSRRLLHPDITPKKPITMTARRASDICEAEPLSYDE